VNHAITEKIKVVLYTAPIRRNVELPYVPEEYEACKNQVKELARKTGAIYADLESLVPGEFWGKKGSTALNGTLELDFFHFQAAGHSILADALAELIRQ
jgi:lysophospholipase L1-like esterase